MATIQKSTKINFYKFVQVKQPSGGTTSAKTDSNVALTKSINTNTLAINNLGNTVNSLAKVVSDLKKVQLAQLDADQRKRVGFEAKYTETQKRERKSEGGITAAIKTPSFLEGLFNILGGLIKTALVIPALKWLADPKNQETIKTVIDVIKTVAEFVFKWAEFGITNTINGLYDLLKDDATWQERLTGFGKAIAGIGAIVLGVRYLSNPTKLISDMYRGVRALIGFVTGRGGGGGKTPRTRRGGALRTLLGVGVTAAAGYGLYQSFQEPEYAQGGKLPGKAQGGWIRGPQSGYKVSLDGGRSTSFIGHGTEYVARKANGGAFVVPFNTPATARQPHLTSKRISEAKSQGYKLPGFAEGGAVGRPWWDKFGWFGGAAAERARQKPSKDSTKEKVFESGAKTEASGAGLPAVIAGGKWALSKGFTVAEHPNFKKNNWSGSGPNTEIGYNKDGGERVGGHSSGSLHYQNLAIDVTDWRGGDWKGRTAQLAEEAYKNRKRMKLSQIIHDGWGSWFNGGSKRGAGSFGHPEHLHLGFAKGLGDALTGAISASSHGYGALLDLIGKRESDSVGGFNAVNQGGADGGHTALGYSGDYRKAPFNPSGKALTDMTVAEIMQLQHDDGKLSDAQWKTSGKLHAVGRYQFIGSTLKGLINQGVAKRTDKFSPEIQNKLAVALLKGKSVSQLKGTWIGLQHETDAAVSSAMKAGGDTTAGGGATGGGSYSPSGLGVHNRENDLLSSIANVKASSATTVGYGRSDTRQSKIQEAEQARQQTQIQTQTDQRNEARRQVTERSQQLIQTALTAIAQQNGVNSQAIQAAQRAVQIAMSQEPQQPMLVGGGSTSTKSTASTLMSTLNPLKGILK